MPSGDAVDRSPHQALEMLKCILRVTVVAVTPEEGSGPGIVALGLPRVCLVVSMSWWDHCSLAGLEMNFVSAGINSRIPGRLFLGVF